MPTGKPQSTVYGPLPTHPLQMANKAYVDLVSMWDTILVKPADEIITNDGTLSTDSTLVSAAEALSTYVVEIWMIVDSSATPDFRYSLDYSGTTLAGFYTIDISGITTVILGSGSSLVGSTWPVMKWFKGWIKTNAAGNIEFQWSQNTSNGANTTLMAGSSMFIKKVA